MVEAARALAARGITTATFDFPYVAAGRSVPDKAPVLEATWRAAIAAARARRRHWQGLPLFIGGKSMGGRIASHVAVAGPAASGNRTGSCFSAIRCIRRDGLSSVATRTCPSIEDPMLFVQGTRDPFGTADEIRALLPALEPAREAVRGRRTAITRSDVRVKVTGKKQDAVLDRDLTTRSRAFILRPDASRINEWPTRSPLPRRPPAAGTARRFADRFKWNVSDIFDSWEAWDAGYKTARGGRRSLRDAEGHARAAAPRRC